MQQHRVVEKVQAVTLHDLVDPHGLTDLDSSSSMRKGPITISCGPSTFPGWRSYINYESSLLGENARRCRDMLAPRRVWYFPRARRGHPGRSTNMTPAKP